MTYLGDFLQRRLWQHVMLSRLNVVCGLDPSNVVPLLYTTWTHLASTASRCSSGAFSDVSHIGLPVTDTPPFSGHIHVEFLHLRMESTKHCESERTTASFSKALIVNACDRNPSDSQNICGEYAMNLPSAWRTAWLKPISLWILKLSTGRNAANRYLRQRVTFPDLFEIS